MDVAPVSSIVPAPPATGSPAPFAGMPTSLSPRHADILAAWPRSAQFAAAFLLGGIATLLGYFGIAHLRNASEPAQAMEPQPVTYRVDLNEARRPELLQLPGIGPSLADRIEEYRRLHGGFRSVEELRRVSGIGPATMEKLRPLVCVRPIENPIEAQPRFIAKNDPVSKSKAKGLVDINSASLAELQTLPGIGPKLSQRIVDERERKAFTTVEDLRRVAGIGAKTMEKLRPYVTVAPAAK